MLNNKRKCVIHEIMYNKLIVLWWLLSARFLSTLVDSTDMLNGHSQTELKLEFIYLSNCAFLTTGRCCILNVSTSSLSYPVHNRNSWMLAYILVNPWFSHHKDYCLSLNRFVYSRNTFRTAATVSGSPSPFLASHTYVPLSCRLTFCRTRFWPEGKTLLLSPSLVQEMWVTKCSNGG